MLHWLCCFFTKGTTTTTRHNEQEDDDVCLSEDGCNNNLSPGEGLSYLDIDMNYYNMNGYYIFRNLFDIEEVSIIKEAIINDEYLLSNEFNLFDGIDNYCRITIWSYLSNDTFGNVIQSSRMINIVRKLINSDDISNIKHYHSKLNRKNYNQGSFTWHQGYGFYYDNGMLFADGILTAFIAITDCNILNGCLQIISGSHKLGRLRHVYQGEQRAIENETMNLILNITKDEILSKQLNLHHKKIELNKGDVIFFHSGIIHTSDINKNKDNKNGQRWAILPTYNDNVKNPIFKKHHHYCTDINIKNDDMIKKIGAISTQKFDIDNDIFHNPRIFNDDTVNVKNNPKTMPS